MTEAVVQALYEIGEGGDREIVVQRGGVEYPPGSGKFIEVNTPARVSGRFLVSLIQEGVPFVPVEEELRERLRLLLQSD